MKTLKQIRKEGYRKPRRVFKDKRRPIYNKKGELVAWYVGAMIGEEK